MLEIFHAWANSISGQYKEVPGIQSLESRLNGKISVVGFKKVGR